MDSPEFERELNRLDHELKLVKFRAEIHESILLKVRVALNLYKISSPQDPEKAVRDAQERVLEELEGIASRSEKLFLSSPAYSELDDAEKALYADEIRAIVDHMKAFVVS